MISRGISPVVLIVAGLAGLAWLGWSAATFPRSDLVRVPIEVDAGRITTVRFTPDASHSYFVNLSFSGNEREVVCAVGSGRSYPFDLFGCQGDPKFVVAWTLSDRQNIVIARGNSTSYQSDVVLGNGSVIRTIGSFEGTSRAEYSLTLRITPGTHKLDQYSPTLIVEAPSINEEGEYLFPAVAFVSILAIILGSTGLGMRRKIRKSGKSDS